MSEQNLYQHAIGKGKLKLKGVTVSKTAVGNKSSSSSSTNRGTSFNPQKEGSNSHIQKQETQIHANGHDSDDGDNPPVVVQDTSALATVANTASSTSSPSEASNEIERIKGKGKISFSGNLIVGEGTNFTGQGIDVGDFIIVGSEGVEVKTVFSERSLRVSGQISAENSDYEIIKKPTQSSSRKRDREESEVERSNFHGEEGAVDKPSNTFTYREKKPGAFGGYRTVKDTLASSNLSRSDLLDIRAKKKSDRHCM